MIRRRMAATIAASVGVVLLLVVGTAHSLLLDGLDGWLLSTFYQDDTTYAPRYSDAKFRSVTAGMDRAKVTALLGRPLHETWIYEHDAVNHLVLSIDLLGQVQAVSGPGASSHPNIQPGVSVATARSVLGPPSIETWAFTKTLHDSSYKVRVVVFRGGIVERKIHEYYWD